MSAAARSILMRVAAVVFVGLVPALCFSILWQSDVFRTGKALIYGPVALGALACVSYALFETALRRYASFVVGALGTAAMVAILWTMLVPVAALAAPGSLSRSAYWEIVILGVFAAMPLGTAVTLFAWARRASRAAASDTSGSSVISMMAGISVLLLAPILAQMTVSRWDASVTQAILAASDDEGRANASDVGLWKHLASWRELERAALHERGYRHGGSDGPTAASGPRVAYLDDCYMRIAGHRAQNW